MEELKRFETGQLVSAYHYSIWMLLWRWLRRHKMLVALATLSLLIGVATYVLARTQQERATGAKVAALLNEGRGLMSKARAENAEVEGLRKQAFWYFDNKQADKGEGVWEKALQGARETATLYEKSGRSLEAAVALGKGFATAKSLVADVLYERALLAERDGKTEVKDELLERLRLYDDGSRTAKWIAPGKLDITVEPAGALVNVQRYRERESQNPVLENLNLQLATPVHDFELPQGSYLLTFTAASRATVHLPVLVRRASKSLVCDSTLREHSKGLRLHSTGHFHVWEFRR